MTAKTTNWTEYGVLLAIGVVAPAACASFAKDYPHGWPVVRTVSSTAVDHSGAAVVEIGPWVTVR